MTLEAGKKIDDFFLNHNTLKYDKGQILIYGGDEPAGITYLISGEVRQYDIAPNGEELVVNVYKPGAFFPMSWALNKTPNRYFFEAASDIEVKQVPADQVVQFVKSNPDVALDLLSRVYKGIDGVLQRLTYLMGGSAHNRTIFEIINATKRFGQKKENGSYVVNIAENELARRAGLTRETFNREIRKLKEKQLLEIQKNEMIVKDLVALEKRLER
jgi:CRP/FNR family cyclic AMP-dependent transcriptional regulator